MVHFKKRNANLKMINKLVILLTVLYAGQVFGNQYALTVFTNYRGNDNKSVSHIPLYKSKNLFFSKLDNINLSLSKGGSMGVKYISGILSAKYKNIEKIFKCLRISQELKTDF